MRHAHAVSYERLAALLETQFGTKLSEGALASILAAAAPAFAVQFGTIRQRLLAGSVICSDEAGFRVGKRNNWIWVFQHADCCCFVSAPTRGKVVVAEFLGGVRPLVWVSDRLKAQTGWAEKHQACLAHLLRDAQYALDCGDVVLAARVMSLLRRSIRIWRYRERLERRFGPGVLIAFFWRHFIELDALLAAPIVGNQAGEKLRRSLLRDQDKLFVFLAEQDVPPTNNSSEQALRWSAVFHKVTNWARTCMGLSVSRGFCRRFLLSLRFNRVRSRAAARFRRAPRDRGRRWPGGPRRSCCPGGCRARRRTRQRTRLVAQAVRQRRCASAVVWRVGPVADGNGPGVAAPWPGDGRGSALVVRRR